MNARVGVVGYGRFGRALGELVRARGGQLVAFDCDPAAAIPEGARAASLEAVARTADVVAVATPVAAMPAVFDAIARALAGRTDAPLVLDVGSVKVAPAAALARAFPKDARFVPTHPLFGPTSLARAERPLTVVVCPGASEEATRAAEAFWRSLDCEIVRVDAEEHDRVMARTHALAFFFAKGIVDAGLDEAAPFSPPSFQAMARSVEAVRADAGHLFRSIEVDNPFAAGVRADLLRALAAADAELAHAASAPEPPTIPPARATSPPASELAEARALIDELDRDLVRLLARRAALAERAAHAKGALGVATRDPAREAEVLAARRAWAEAAGLDAEAVAAVFEAILEFSRRHQTSRA